jgi:hypothetical protein
VGDLGSSKQSDVGVVTTRRTDIDVATTRRARDLNFGKAQTQAQT